MLEMGGGGVGSQLGKMLTNFHLQVCKIMENILPAATSGKRITGELRLAREKTMLGVIPHSCPSLQHWARSPFLCHKMRFLEEGRVATAPEPL